MAAQYLTAWNPDAIEAAHNALLGLLDADSNPAKVTIHNSSDTLLATVTLTDPAGTVNTSTGKLTLTQSASTTAIEDGTASYASLRDGAGVVYRSYPCSAGSSPVVNTCVITDLVLSVGQQVDILSFEIQ
jgi:hypothetical protein